MTPITAPRAAACEQCTWRATGSTAWTDGDAHASTTGHTVVRTGTDTGTRPAPFTQPHEGTE
jgi:hypothetical protein